MTSFYIPQSVSFIEAGSSILGNPDTLLNIYVDDANAYYSDISGVLFDEAQTTVVAYSAGRQEKTYSIPDNITSIGKCAFKNAMNLQTVSIPDSVTAIGSSAFMETGIISMEIPEKVTSIESAICMKCMSLASITIPSGVTAIGEEAFEDCLSLTSVDIPSGVVTIGQRAFLYCSFKSVTIPESVTAIGVSAFEGCPLSSVTIPPSVQYLETYDFGDMVQGVFNITPDFVLSGWSGSAAEEYAQHCGIAFQSLGIYVPGDMDGDGFIRIEDAANVFRALNNALTQYDWEAEDSSTQSYGSDMNRDGIFDIIDTLTVYLKTNGTV